MANPLPHQACFRKNLNYSQRGGGKASWCSAGQLGRGNGSSSAGLCQVVSMPACPTEGSPCLSPCPVVPVTVNNTVLVAGSHSPWRTPLTLVSFRGAHTNTSHPFPIRKNPDKPMCLLIFLKLGHSTHTCDLVHLSITGFLRIFSLILHTGDCIYPCQSFYL